MGALDGILVISIEQAVAAPLCTVRLADAGARVIKIERTEGETARHYDYAAHGTCTYFAWLNRGKESAVLDLKDAQDMALFRRMLAQADVLVQNLAPGAMARLGLDEVTLTRDFPHLIAATICGYGGDTPYAQMKAYDMLVQAESGICAVTGTPDAPSKVGAPVADVATGGNAHAAILEALIERGRSGRGQCIEISMFDGLADWMTVPFLHYEHSGVETGRYGLAHATVYPYRPYSSRNGTILIAVQTNAQWRRFCELALNRPDLVSSPNFATNADRVANRSAVDAELEPFFAALDFDEAIARCETAGIAWSRYRSVREMTMHPALRRMTVEAENGMQISLPRPAGRDTRFRAGPLPALGAHTDAVRKEFGG
jgi:crotonobetainyl-CoA:carnitine CoA-transferase CaiB-like acyl-CoA transferase